MKKDILEYPLSEEEKKELEILRKTQESVIRSGFYPPAEITERIIKILEKLPQKEVSQKPSSAHFILNEAGKNAQQTFSIDKKEESSLQQ